MDLADVGSNVRPVGSLARRWTAASAVCLGLFLVGIDATVLNVAIPDLQRDLRPSIAEVQWIVDGYAVVMAGTVLAAGTVADRFGRRRVFLCGLLLCLAASVAGGLGESPAEVIAARVAMGLGAAFLMPSTLSIVTHLFPEPRLRRHAIAVWSGVAGISSVLGPVVGGWLVDHSSWRAGFWVNVPIVILSGVPAAWLVPESKDPHASRLDHAGAGLSVAGLTALVWAVVEGPGRGWSSPQIVAAFVAAVALLTAFTLRQAHGRAPMLPLPLLRVPRVGLGLGAIVLLSFTAFGCLFVTTLYLQEVLGYTPWEAGVRTLPVSAGLIAGAGVAVPLGERADERTLILSGLGCVTLALAVLGGTTSGSGYGRLVVFQLIVGAGCGLALAVITQSIMDAFPADRAGLGSGLNDVTRQVGSALGVAVQGSVLAAVSAHRLRDLLGDAGTPDGADVNGIINAAPASGGAPTRMLLAAKEAFVSGMAGAAAISAVITGAATVVAAAFHIRDRFR